METKKSWQIEAPNILAMKVKIVGTSPLIFNRWSEKAKKMILDKQMKRANKGHAIRDPKAEYEGSFYHTVSGKIGFPALALKQAMVGAARNVEGLQMTLLRGCIFVTGDSSGMLEVKFKKKSMRDDMVRIGMGVADLRFRGQVEDWSMEPLIKYNADVISDVQVLNLLQIAGFSCGLGEWRPERNGDFGCFEVQKTSAKPNGK